MSRVGGAELGKAEDRDRGNAAGSPPEAASGAERAAGKPARAALERVREACPDLAVLDLGLPDMSGYELAERIRQLDGSESIRLVALTGYGLPEEVQRGREAGFDEHLVKPVQVRRLLDLIA